MARRVSSPYLIGRREELDRLTKTLAESAAGRASFVVVAGEAGVGKTRLLAEFGDRAGLAGARVLGGGCVPLGEVGLPYGPIVEALRRLFRSLERRELDVLLGSAKPEIGRLVPGFGFGPAPGASGDCPAAQGRLFELLFGLLTRIAARAPLVLEVEDLHWADQGTLDLLSFLGRNLRDERAVIIGTYRSDDLHGSRRLVTFLDELGRALRVEHLQLGPLDRDEVREQAAAILGREPEPRLVARLLARSEGNPYYVEELLAAGGGTGELPPTLREALLTRVAALSKPTRQIVRVASAGGARIDAETVAQVADVDPDTLATGLREAVACQLLVPAPDGGDRFGFRHALLAEAVYGELLPGERSRLHAAFARVITRAIGPGRDPSVAAEVAYHWAMANDLPRAFTASLGAGLAARDAYAFASAEAQFERAIDLWDRVPDAAGAAGMDLPALLEVAARAADAAGSAIQATAHVERALALIDAVTDPVRAGLFHTLLGDVAARAGDPRRSLEAHTTATRLIPAAGPPAARARVLAGLLYRMMMDRQNDAALAVGREALAAAREGGARDVEADLMATLGAVEGTLGMIDEAAATLRRGRDLAIEIGDLRAAGRAWLNLTGLLEPEEAASEAQAVEQWAVRHGLGGDAAMATGNRALALWQLGRWVAADATLDRVQLDPLEGGAAMNIEISQAHFDIGRGRFEVAEQRLERIRAYADRYPGADWMRFERGLTALLNTERGEPRGVLAPVEQGLPARDDADIGLEVEMSWLRWIGLRAAADLASAARLRRDRAGLVEATRTGERLLDRARSLAIETAGSHPSLHRRAAWAAALCEAEWSRLTGNADSAPWAVAAGACGEASQLQFRPYATYRRAEALLRAAHDRSHAAPLLLEAHRAATAMGARPLVQRIEALARQARVELAERRPAGGAVVESPGLDPYGLTPRERDVLELVAAGRTNRQIAEALFIGERTVGVHVSAILGKLGASSRTQAAALALRTSHVSQAPVGTSERGGRGR